MKWILKVEHNFLLVQTLRVLKNRWKRRELLIFSLARKKVEIIIRGFEDYLCLGALMLSRGMADLGMSASHCIKCNLAYQMSSASIKLTRSFVLICRNDF